LFESPESKQITLKARGILIINTVLAGVYGGVCNVSSEMAFQLLASINDDSNNLKIGITIYISIWVVFQLLNLYIL